jgi:hypothetical protein
MVNQSPFELNKSTNNNIDLSDDNNKGYFYTETMNGLFLVTGSHG